jgi:cell division ATPase FtsA
MSRTFAAGIDIGTATISAAVAMHDKTQQQFRLLGAATVAASGLRKGMVTDGRRLREQIRAVVREAERAADVPIRHAYLAAAGAHLSAIRTKGSVMIARADGEVTEHDMERVQNAARKKLHSIVEARLSDVFELVERYLKRIDRNGLLPGGVVCTGGGTLLGIVPEHARATRLRLACARKVCWKSAGRRVWDFPGRGARKGQLCAGCARFCPDKRRPRPFLS